MDDIIERLLDVRNGRPGKQVQLAENEISKWRAHAQGDIASVDGLESRNRTQQIVYIGSLHRAAPRGVLQRPKRIGLQLVYARHPPAGQAARAGGAVLQIKWQQ